MSYWVFGIGLLALFAIRFTDVLELTTALGRSRGREPIDTAAPLPAYREPLPYGAVHMPGEADSALALAGPGEDSAARSEPLPTASPATIEPKTEPEVGNEFDRRAAAEKAAPPTGYAPGVDVELLKTVKDRTPLREDENRAWYHLLDVVNRAPQAELTKAATPIDSFRMIYEQSKFYRGRPVKLHGIARWYREHKADAGNAAGIERYFEIGLQFSDTEDNPLFVYCVELPADWPRGKPDPADAQRFLLKQTVKLTGVGFKNFSYSAGDTLRDAPLIMAKTIELGGAAPQERKFSLKDVGGPLLLLVLGVMVLIPLLRVVFGGRRTTFSLGDAAPKVDEPRSFIPPIDPESDDPNAATDIAAPELKRTAGNES